MTIENLKSPSITNFDATPVTPVTTGMGNQGRIFAVDDVVSPTASGLGSTTTTYRICRFPTFAKIKKLTLATSTSLDTNGSPSLVFDINVIFSDSTVDGTQPAYQNLIPTTANTGATTTLAAYSAPNKLFGQWTPFTASAHTAGAGPSDLTFNGIGTTYPFKSISMQPLWNTFGFVDGRGNPMDPGGYFDLLLYISTASATAQAGDIYARLEYVV